MLKRESDENTDPTGKRLKQDFVVEDKDVEMAPRCVFMNEELLSSQSVSALLSKLMNSFKLHTRSNCSCNPSECTNALLKILVFIDNDKIHKTSETTQTNSDVKKCEHRSTSEFFEAVFRSLNCLEARPEIKSEQMNEEKQSPVLRTFPHFVFDNENRMIPIHTEQQAQVLLSSYLPQSNLSYLISSCIDMIGQIVPSNETFLHIPETLLNYLNFCHPHIRRSAAQSIVTLHRRGFPLHSEELFDVALRYFHDTDVEVRKAFITLSWLMCHSGQGKLKSELLFSAFSHIIIEDNDPNVKSLCCSLLGCLGNVSEALLLRSLTKSAQMKNIFTSTDMPFRELIRSGCFVHAIEDEFQSVRIAAINAICELSIRSLAFGQKAIDYIADMVVDEIEQVRITALDSLRRLRKIITLSSNAFAPILSSTNEISLVVREAAYKAIGEISANGKTTTYEVLSTLLQNLSHFPEDQQMILGCISKFAFHHAPFVEFFVNDLFKFDPLFLPIELRVDDIYTAGALLACVSANANTNNNNVLALLPSYTTWQLKYMKDKYPMFFSQESLSELQKEDKVLKLQQNNIQDKETKHIKLFFLETIQKIMEVKLFTKEGNQTIDESIDSFLKIGNILPSLFDVCSFYYSVSLCFKLITLLADTEELDHLSTYLLSSCYSLQYSYLGISFPLSHVLSFIERAVSTVEREIGNKGNSARPSTKTLTFHKHPNDFIFPIEQFDDNMFSGITKSITEEWRDLLNDMKGNSDEFFDSESAIRKHCLQQLAYDFHSAVFSKQPKSLFFNPNKKPDSNTSHTMVQDHLFHVRCFRCHKLGHVARYCLEEKANVSEETSSLQDYTIDELWTIPFIGIHRSCAVLSLPSLYVPIATARPIEIASPYFPATFEIHAEVSHIESTESLVLRSQVGETVTCARVPYSAVKKTGSTSFAITMSIMVSFDQFSAQLSSAVPVELALCKHFESQRKQFFVTLSNTVRFSVILTNKDNYGK